MSESKGRKKRVYRWSGQSGTVSWHQDLCIHVGECTRAGELFESGRDPWCMPDAAKPEELAAVVRRCPTGALDYQAKEGDGPAEAPDAENTITVANNGPFYARGELKIAGAPGDAPGTRYRAALCRCGRSRVKPFCDNAHEETGFRDRGAVGQEGPGLEGARGPLEIGCAKDGPLLLKGPVTIVAGSGRRAWSGTKAALCRCGHSKNKPFCDGAHKAAGFKAD